MSDTATSAFDGLAASDQNGNLAPIHMDRLDERYQAGGEAATSMVNAVVTDPATTAGALVDSKAGQLAATTGDQSARLDAYLQDGRAEVKRLVGHFRLGRPLVIPSNVSLDVSAATFSPDTTTGWTSATLSDYSARALIEIPARSNITITGTLRLIGDAAAMAEANRLCSCALYITGGTNNIRIGDVDATGFGSPVSRPSSGVIRFVAQGTASHLSELVPSAYKTSAHYGAATNIAIGNVTITQPADVFHSFGIRFLTDWDGSIPRHATVGRITNVSVGDVTLVGEFGWNAIEYAGTGTYANTIGNIHHSGGNTITVLDYDKGASYNTAGRVVAIGTGLPDWLASNGSVRLAIVNVHGFAAGARSDGNRISEVIALDCDNPTTRQHSPYAAVVSVSYATGTRIDRITVSNFLTASVGTVLFVDHGALDTSVGTVRFDGVSTAIHSQPNSDTHGNLSVGRIDGTCVGAGVVWHGKVGAAIGPIDIREGRLVCTSIEQNAVTIGSTTVGSNLGSLEAVGGKDGFRIAGPTTVLNGTHARNAAAYSYRLQSGVDPAVTGDQPLLIGARSTNPGTGHQVLNGATPTKVGVLF